MNWNSGPMANIRQKAGASEGAGTSVHINLKARTGHWDESGMAYIGNKMFLSPN